ncbi:mitochondrial escape protein 2 [Rhodotorula mucilaginosa]|uniref:Mitochondrial escape protein 2 n=1 Tax=Rhodotorula mucilaginosa TaxID=5537 RepID=A0A9P6VTL2_RHOMI|nr:mitochondrial escape protein 2 [Rhodotorula mucilaginosa]
MLALYVHQSLPPRCCRPILLRPARRVASTVASTNWTQQPDAIRQDGSTTTDESQAKHDPTRRAAYLWYDTLFPIRFAIWDVRGLVSRLQQNDLLNQVRQLVPEDPRYAVTVESVEPRAKDGGAFVRLSYSVPEDVVDAWRSALTLDAQDEAEKAAKSKEMETRVTSLIEREARDALVKSGFRPWFSLGRPCRAFLVQGVPWMEDLDRFPSRELQVEMAGPAIPQEELYAIFRPYGRIHDIVPGDKVARIMYTSIRSATAARNCLHAAAHTSHPPNAADPKTTVMRIFYADKKRASWIKDFAANHPRITIPLLVALIGSLSYFVWDPIRETVVKAKVEGTLDANRWRVVRWVKRETLGRLGLSGGKNDLDAAAAAGRTGIEEERQQAKEQLSTWLKDVPDTFIILTGPHGSGKSGLVDEVLGDGKNVLTIDCEDMLKNARSESKLISALASSTGYWPQFAFASSVSNLVDLATMGLIGQKAGFSASFEEQLKAILEVTGSALSSIASSIKTRTAAAIEQSTQRKETAGQRHAVAEQLETTGVRDGRLDYVSGTGLVAELGAGIEGPAAGAEKETSSDTRVEIIGPKSSAFVRAAASEHATNGEQAAAVAFERLPVVVIKGFAAKGDAMQEKLWDVLSEWAAVLVENQVAHVIFTSDSVTTTKPLAKALPSKPFNLITLNDASPDASLQYVSAKLAAFDQTLPTDEHEAVALLGGRQTDLELLVQKIRAGQTAGEAVDDLIQRNASEIHKKLFGDDEEEAKSFKWSKQQALDLIKGLSEKGELKYAETLLTTFGGDDGPLRALESAALISIQHSNGRPSTIKPGKPVYRAACELLLADAPFRAAIEYRTAVAGIASANAAVASAQAELIELSKLFTGDQGRWAFGGGSRVPKEVETRVGQLLANMRAGEEKADKLGQEKDRLLKILQERQ